MQYFVYLLHMHSNLVMVEWIMVTLLISAVFWATAIRRKSLLKSSAFLIWVWNSAALIKESEPRRFLEEIWKLYSSYKVKWRIPKLILKACTISFNALNYIYINVMEHREY